MIIRIITMVWTFALWFMLVAVSASFITDSGNSLDYWENIFKKFNHLVEQSPVNISTKNIQKRHLPPLNYSKRDFNKTVVEIINTGHTVCVRFANKSQSPPFISGGPLKSVYAFKEIHFHWGTNDSGSEHFIDGYQYAMEVHMVHFKKEYGSYENAKKYRDGLCVVGFFGVISSKDNQEMGNFIKDLKKITKFKSSFVKNFDDEFSWFKDRGIKQPYFTYHGSLTTGPFTECVIWIIFDYAITISRRQLMEFRKLHSGYNGEFINQNGRDLQPLNYRVVGYGF